jgi:hypothetical protein
MLPLGVAQIQDEPRKLTFHLLPKCLTKRSTFGGEGHVNRPSIACPRRSMNKPSTLCARHEPGHTRFIEPQTRRKIEHRRLTIAQNTQKAHLNERKIVLVGHMAKRRVNSERELHQAV